MKKLALLCPPIPPNHLGGDGKFAYDIAVALSQNGVQVVLFSLLYNNVKEPYNVNDNLMIVPIPIEDNEAKDIWDVPIWDKSFTTKRDKVILEYLKRFNVLTDEYWIHEIGGSLYNSVLGYLHEEQGLSYSCHVQFVLKHYFHYFPESGKFAQNILKSQEKLVSGANISFFLSNFDRRAFQDIPGLKVVVPNGTHLQKTDTKHNGKLTDLHIYYGGRLHNPMKGAALILPVISETMKRNTNIFMHISAPDRTFLDLIDETVSERLHYHGWLSTQETLALIRLCDITLVPSVYEPFGLLAIESLAQGVPVIANNNGGLADIIVTGKNGLFIDLNNPSYTEDMLTNLAQDATLLNKLAPDPSYGLDRYDIERIAGLYEDALVDYLA